MVRLPGRPFAFCLAISPLTLSCGFAQADTSRCEQNWPEGQVVAQLSDEVIDESSGLADSWLHTDRLWTHNDSGDEPRLWALRKNGRVTTEVRLSGAENIDWEDMAIAPCGEGDDRPCIYVGDIGDNLSRRETVTIYRFPEPDLGDDPPAELVIEEFETLTYRYAAGPRDAETLLVHPVTRQIWVIEKTGELLVDVFAIPEEFDNAEPHVVEAVATLEVPGMHPLMRMVTGGDISPDGSEFSYRTYVYIFTHCVTDPEDFASAFAAEPTRTTAMPATIQGEALTYDRQDMALWLTSEMVPAPLIRLPPRGTLPDENTTDDDAVEDLEPDDVDGDDEQASADEEPESAASSSCSAVETSGPGSLLALIFFAGLFVFFAGTTKERTS